MSKEITVHIVQLAPLSQMNALGVTRPLIHVPLTKWRCVHTPHQEAEVQRQMLERQRQGFLTIVEVKEREA